MLWGAWPQGEKYVKRLKSMVDRHLTIEHDFIAITNHSFKDIKTLPLPTAHWPKNLPKMQLYSPDNGLEGRILAIDLDVVIVGNIDEIALYNGEFCNVEDFYEHNKKSGGSLIAFEAGNKRLQERLFDPLLLSPERVAKLCCGGAERHWFRRQIPNSDFWQDLYMDQVVSAKPNRTVIKEAPTDARMIFFHGREKPHNYTHLDWVNDNWN